MQTKLTLSMPSEVVEMAKKEVGKQGISLSKFTANMYRSILIKSENKPIDKFEVPKNSFAHKNRGILGKYDREDYKEELYKYLSEKYE